MLIRDETRNDFKQPLIHYDFSPLKSWFAVKAYCHIDTFPLTELKIKMYLYKDGIIYENVILIEKRYSGNCDEIVDS